MTAKQSASIIIVIVLLLLLTCNIVAIAQDGLNPAGEARYGRRSLAPGFSPSPFTIDVLSGGDNNVKALGLGENCLGYAATEPDVEVELAAGFGRITFLIDSAEDSTLIINLPNGAWSCNDDSNGLNPALVYHNALPGVYQIWIGSYAADAFEEAVLYVSEADPESLPSTATGPDPGRDALYGEATLEPGFYPPPLALQIIGGGRNQAADYVPLSHCQGYVAEAPDFSIMVSEELVDLWFSLFSPAEMLLLVNDANGNWHCSSRDKGRDPSIRIDYAWTGLYDIWVGSIVEDNYAASIFYVTEGEPDAALSFSIDTSCPGLLATDLGVGGRAVVAGGLAEPNPLYAVPETASTVIFRAGAGSSMTIIGGPICDDGRRWWRVALNDGSRGWIADGDSGSHWLLPAE